MKDAALCGLKRGAGRAVLLFACLLAVRLGRMAAEQALLLAHGGGDVWLST